MVDLAAVYVPVTPSLRGAAGVIQKELGGIDVGRVGSDLGQSLGSRLASTAGTVIKTGAFAVGATLAAGVGAALVKGFARLDAIDVARAKLTGLGNDAGTVQAVMQNALAAVRGTAFGLGDAATVAAQLVAAQIKPGEQLQGVLKSVANAAAAAGTDLNDMGSIYAKVASLGKAQNDVLQQVADRGIPIYQALADQFGVTTEEIFKMASEGKIGFSEFQSAMTSAAGTVADELGNTVGGAFSNFSAALGRIGAGLLGGVFPQIAPSIKAITAAMQPLEAVSGVIGSQIGSFVAPAMERFVSILRGDVQVGWITEVAGGIRAMVAAFKDGGNDLTSAGFAGVLESVGLAARSVVDSGILAFASPFALIVSVLGDSLPTVATALADVASTIAVSLAGALPQVVSALGAVTQVLLPGLAPLLPALTTAVRFIGEGLAGAINLLGPALGPLTVGLLAAVVAMKAFAAVTAVQAAGGLLRWVAATKLAAAAQLAFNLVMNANPIMLIITAITALVAGLVYFFTQTELGQAIWAEFTRFLGEAWANIVNVATTVFTALGDFFTTVWNGIVDVVTTVWNNVVGFLGPIFDFIATLIRVYVETWVNIFMVMAAVLITIWDAVTSVVTTVWNAIVDFLSPIVSFIANLIIGYFTTTLNFWTGVWDAVSSFFMNAWNGIVGFIVPIVMNVVSAIRGPVQAIASWWDSTWSGISSTLSTIWNTMVGIVSGAVGQIGSTISTIYTNVTNVFSNVGRWLFNSGRALIQGFIDGITGMIGAVGDAVNGVIDWARGFFPNSPAKRGPLSGSGWTKLRESGAAMVDQWHLGISDGGAGFTLSASSVLPSVAAQGSAAAAMASGVLGSAGQQSQIVGASITGRLEIGGDGLGRIIDGRITDARYQSGAALSGGSASR